MLVSDLILHLSNYASRSPENGSAQVRFQSPEGMRMTWGISGANDARGVTGGRLLILLPDVGAGGLGIREGVQ